MTNLTKAHDELYRRGPDETFPTMQALWDHCHRMREQSQDRWHPPGTLSTRVTNDALVMTLGSDGAFSMNDWSFTQLCRLADVAKDTVNRLSPATASTVLAETLPKGNGNKPFQILTEDDRVRSIHGASYTRLWNVELLSMIQEFATDFQPPQQAVTGGTGLYAGEQDLFVFLVDPLGWVEIEDEAYAPGVFLYNSEVGRRALGCQTFWFQAVCQNHIVWDATEVTEYTRKHTARVNEGLSEIRAMIEAIVAKRDARKDGFVSVIRKAMETKLGDDAEEALKEVTKNGIPRSVAKEAITLAEEKGRFTIWAVIDALTRLAQQSRYAGDRVDADEKAAKLLSLVA
jgi:histone H3/H4